MKQANLNDKFDFSRALPEPRMEEGASPLAALKVAFDSSLLLGLIWVLFFSLLIWRL